MSAPPSPPRLKRLLALLAVAALALAGCAHPTSGTGAAASGAASAASQATAFTFTDSTGRQVELPTGITRVASAGPLANIMLYALAPETLVGWSQAPGGEARAYIDQKYLDLPEYGKFYGDSGDFNREAVLASDPQVIVDVGDWDEEYKTQLDDLQGQLGIPVILIDGDLAASGEAFRLLGAALGRQEAGEKLAVYADTVISDVQSKAGTIPQDQRLSVYYGEGQDGLSTMVAGSSHAQVFDMVGADLVAGKDSVQKARGGGTVSLEQILAWNPDAIVFASGSIGAGVSEDASWSSLSAVQAGRVYTVPVAPYNWIGRPPGPNRLLGVQWLGSVLYPQTFAYDMVAKTKEFYSLFYHHDLTDDEARALLGR